MHIRAPSHLLGMVLTLQHDLPEVGMVRAREGAGLWSENLELSHFPWLWLGVRGHIFGSVLSGDKKEGRKGWRKRVKKKEGRKRGRQERGNSPEGGKRKAAEGEVGLSEAQARSGPLGFFCICGTQV